MAKILFMKFGKSENGVTKVLEKDIDAIEALIGSRQVIWIGSELSAIGNATPLTDYSGPDIVVIQVSESEAKILGRSDPGFYWVRDLQPLEVHNNEKHNKSLNPDAGSAGAG